MKRFWWLHILTPLGAFTVCPQPQFTLCFASMWGLATQFSQQWFTPKILATALILPFWVYLSCGTPPHSVSNHPHDHSFFKPLSLSRTVSCSIIFEGFVILNKWEAKDGGWNNVYILIKVGVMIVGSWSNKDSKIIMVRNIFNKK